MLLRDMVTDYNNIDGDTGRGIAVLVIVAMIALQTYVVWRNGVFDPIQFGSGIAAVLAALGIYIYGDNHNRPGRVTTVEASSATTTTSQEVPRGST